MSRYSSQGAAGRQLLILKRDIDNESDPQRLRNLRRKEVRLLLSLGQLDRAAGHAGKLASDFPRWPVAHSLLADLMCRLKDWQGAALEFSTAAELYSGSGDTVKSVKIMLGPLFRLYEASGDYSECLELCSRPGQLAAILRCRTERLSGIDSVLPADPCGDWLAAALSDLERVWRGGDPAGLPELVRCWPRAEPEWRWRVLAEGFGIWIRRDLDPEPWRKLFRITERPVLDPRFDSEAVKIEQTLSGKDHR
jgi:hypothetical protein